MRNQLSLLSENGPLPSRACWRHLRAPLATGPVALEQSLSPLPFPTDPSSADDLCWPETVKERRELTETHREFKASDLPPPATISVDPGSRSAQESTTGPLLASAPPRNVKNFGFGQNIGETLLYFRQKSKGNFKSNHNRNAWYQSQSLVLTVEPLF
ncbi:2-oxoglutarate and Fe(II)-dependent oxygenase superfamily protein [Prunus dulcis]|uniref:2-oxoglutarate and Fe(II)-dependent oxygenase superfamily protein n=1 Tax=Prunus dulcis TaxID=3755 RepID=A0A5H2XLM9_PRUDU|nr:2-oxoglutarate and Fe(II)-dependent oxygenase superfamily protein [Prunus dulcis]